jgi:ABC transport system ATP-binding/permease protein
VQLARLLIGDGDVIAHDEPTNHLDIEGISWLAGHLQQRWARNTGRPLLVTANGVVRQHITDRTGL